MFTLEELIDRWEVAKAAGEDHVKVSRQEMRDMYTWQVDASNFGRHLRTNSNTIRHFEGCPVQVVDESPLWNFNIKYECRYKI